MGMTMTQKILAAHAGLDSRCRRASSSWQSWIWCWATTSPSPVAINEFEKAGFDAVFDKNKDQPGDGPLRPQQGHQGRAAVQAVPHVCATNTTSRISTMWARWALSTRCCRKKALWPPATASSARTPTPAPTAHWARFPPAWAPRTWPPAWPPGQAWFKVPAAIKFQPDRRFAGPMSAARM